MNRALERWVGNELTVLREDLAARVRTPHPSDIRHGRARRGVMAVTAVSVGVMAALSVVAASSAVFAPAVPASPAPQPASAGAVPSGPPALGPAPTRAPDRARPPARPAPVRPAPPARPGEGRAGTAPRLAPPRPAPPARQPAAPAVRPVAELHHGIDGAARIGLGSLEPRGDRMSGDHYRHDGRERYPDDRPSRAHGREANLVVELAEVGWTPRRDETRSEVVTSSGETQPVTAATARYPTPDAGPMSGLGPRVEKILLVAEQEAAETRRSATRESTAMIERARDEAESLRHEGEQAVLAFRDEVERYAEDRAAELDDRERRIERERENLRVDGELLLADARREADRILTEAASLAESVRVEVENELAERRSEVERQMGWLEESRRAARDLAHMLLEQAGEAPPAAEGTSTGPHRSAEPSRHTDHTDHTERVDREDTVPVEDTVAVPREPADDERHVRGIHVDDDRDEPVTDLSEPTSATSPTSPTTAVPPVAAPAEPRHQRHSPRAAPPPELRLAGVLGGVPSLAAVEPPAAEEPPTPPAAPSAVPDRAPRERDDRDWFTVGDSTERLRAVPGYRASTPGRTA